MMLRRLIVSITLAALTPCCAFADTVVPGKSEIAFTMKQMGVNFDGRFKQWKADVVFQPNALDKSKADVDIDLGSIDLSSPESETEAKGALWFNTTKFPVAHFASTSIKSVGGDRYEIAGKLSMKGITRDLVVPLVIKSDASGNRVAEGAFAVKRLDYKVGEGEWADPATVDNDVRVKVRMVLEPGA